MLCAAMLYLGLLALGAVVSSELDQSETCLRCTQSICNLMQSVSIYVYTVLYIYTHIYIYAGCKSPTLVA